MCNYTKVCLALKDVRLLVDGQKYFIGINVTGIYSIWMRIGLRHVCIGEYLDSHRVKMAFEVILGGITDAY